MTMTFRSLRKDVRRPALLAAALGTLALACGAGTTDDTARAAWRIVPRKMYSAHDGVHAFRVPMLTPNAFGVKWSVSNPDTAHIDAYEDSDSAQGSEAMVTAKAAGTATLTATAGGVSATSVLTVTEATPQLWEVGRRRYVEGVRIRDDVPDPAAACTNCHGTDKTDIEHTPAQIGGFSDQEVITIFTEGRKPPGVKNRVIDVELWSPVHRWMMDDQEKKGVVVYLRSLSPQSNGTADFGGEGVFEE
jgi:hypothetical protein